MTKHLILCDCTGSQVVDPDDFADLPGLKCSRVHTALCTTEAAAAAEAISAGNALIACGQEIARFEEIAADLEMDPPDFVDIRDRAGWSDDGARAGPKRAALVADAMTAMPAVKTFDVVSEGICLVLGASDVALAAAADLSEALSVTVLLAPGSDLPEPGAFDTVVGHLKRATGALGQFNVRIDHLQEVMPGGRGARGLTPPKNGGTSTCDIILDLRAGEPPLFPAHEKRDGYLRADPGNRTAVQSAVLAASQLTGTFEKPFYVGLTESLCAHSRAEQPACSKCLNVCPTGAITSAGEHVAIDPMICAGCGACAALCPSGAITYEDPTPQALFSRVHRLAETFTAAGGQAPRLLVHAREHGAEMIRLAARYGRGLPADVIPLDLEKVTAFGHAEMLAARASGFVAVDILVPPGADTDVLESELTLATALGGPDIALRLLEPGEPDALSDLLYDATVGPAIDPVLPLGARRQVARLSAKALNPGIEAPLKLPPGSPYGAVTVNTETCTLCLACASLCPAGALGDNPDKPQLRFQEDACLQCGLCVNVCPENALSLTPQMDLSDAALSQQILNEEEPFECIDCGAPFGSRKTIEKITEKLTGHSMFTNNDALKLVQMCDDCRVRAQYHSTANPFAAGDRPKVRTTDDYLAKRRDH